MNPTCWLPRPQEFSLWLVKTLDTVCQTVLLQLLLLLLLHAQAATNGWPRSSGSSRAAGAGSRPFDDSSSSSCAVARLMPCWGQQWQHCRGLAAQGEEGWCCSKSCVGPTPWCVLMCEGAAREGLT